MQEILIIGGIVLGVLGLLPVIVSLFLRDVEAGTIRLVSWLQGYDGDLSGAGKIQRDPPADDRDYPLEQGPQRRPRHHGSDGGRRRTRLPTTH
jgi:hypothetical protein